MRVQVILTLFSCFAFSSCAFTEYGNRINQEHRVIVDLEVKRHRLETQYVIALNNLERFPTEARLIRERDETKKKLLDTGFDLEEKRKLFSLSLQEWEEKILRDRLELEMIEKEIFDGRDVQEDWENQTP